VKRLRANDSAATSVKVGHRQAFIRKPLNSNLLRGFCFARSVRFPILYIGELGWYIFASTGSDTLRPRGCCTSFNASGDCRSLFARRDWPHLACRATHIPNILPLGIFRPRTYYMHKLLIYLKNRGSMRSGSVNLDLNFVPLAI
jgi:hypothetical protein